MDRKFKSTRAVQRPRLSAEEARERSNEATRRKRGYSRRDEFAERGSDVTRRVRLAEITERVRAVTARHCQLSK